MPALYPKKFNAFVFPFTTGKEPKLGVSFFARLRGRNCRLPVRGLDFMGTVQSPVLIQ
jgi:hypothetical protein